MSFRKRISQHGTTQPALLAGIAGALLLGALAGYFGVRALRPEQVVSARAEGGRPVRTGEAAGAALDPAAAAEGTAVVPEAAEADPEMSIAAALRAATENMTPEERFAEIERMLKDPRPFGQGDLQRNWMSLHLRFQALFRPEDLPRLKEMALTPGEQGIPEARRWPFQTAFIMSWTDWDETAVVDWIKQPPGEDRGYMPMMANYSLAMKWSKDDPFVAWDRVARLQEEVPGIGVNGGGFWAVVQIGLQKNAQLTYEKCLTLKNPQERKQMISLVLRHVARTDFDKALEMARAEPQPGLAQELESDAVSSYLYVSKEPGRFGKVADYLLSEEGAQSRSGVLWTLMSSWQKEDPQSAEAWKQANTEFLDDYGVLDNLERADLKKKTTDELLDEAAAMPEGQERAEAYRVALQKLSNRDPERALQELSRLDPETAKKVFGSIGWNYYQSDPGLLGRKLDLLPSEEMRLSATTMLMDQWLKFNPQAASTWLDSQPAGKVKDKGIQRIVLETAKTDPAAAAQWALATSTEEERQAMLVRAAEGWKKKDAQAARRWIWEQKLPAKTTDAFLKALE